MSLDKLITLADVEFETGESRHLINFLIRDREIPFRRLGMAKVLDEAGLELLMAAIRDYRSKPTSQRPSLRPKGSTTKRGAGKKGRKPTRTRNDPDLALSR